MEDKCMKRLYIGGLSHTISQKDIKDRFGKFGEVSGVEIVKRQDETGAPVKTFGYININISEAGLKKCMTVLNKSRWKGGILQIEIAKESFLQRLAQEREQTCEKTQIPQVGLKERLVESFKTAGVENFHMKSAVPGTEIPDHKDWVVSKYGRVLPVLHLKSQIKKKILKYDPSKYCHNIKRLDTESTIQTPVSKLTWEMQDADSEISKKRRGEFLPWKAPPAKTRKTLSGEIAGKAFSKTVQARQDDDSGDLGERNWTKCNANVPALAGKSEAKKQNPSCTLKTSCQPFNVYDSEVDSEDEIKMLVASENTRHVEPQAENEDNLEVVGDDFVVAPNVLWMQRTERKKQECLVKRSEESDGEQSYDSADTDEILAHCKSSHSTEDHKRTKKAVQISVNENTKVKDQYSNPIKVKSKGSSQVSFSELSNESESGSSENASDQSEDSDYEAMMSNCYHLQISLADLEMLSKQAASSDEEKCQGVSFHTEPTQPSGVAVQKKTKPGNTPEEILADILGGDSSDEDKCDRAKNKQKKKTSSLSLPAFTGTKSLMEAMTDTAGQTLEKMIKGKSFTRTELDSKLTLKPATSSDKHLVKHQVEQLSCPGQPRSNPAGSTPSLCKDGKSKQRNGTEPGSDSSSSEDEVTEHIGKGSKLQVKTATKTSKAAMSPMSKHSGAQMLSSSSKSFKSSQEAVKVASVPKRSLSHSETSQPIKNLSQDPRSQDTSERRQEDNQKRLAALQLRQKEAEQQKKHIQDALSKLDTPVHSKAKHIVFDDGDEEDGGSDADTQTPTKTLFEESPESSEESDDEAELDNATTKDSAVKEIQNQGASTLFLSSEDEEDDDASHKDDQQRFQIKPQFEGKAGQKLMELQSRFGTDERFRMDSRFLESDEEKDVEDEKPCCNPLEDEKKKNLSILQNLLQIDIQTSDTSKETVKRKTFRDTNALHYDPTKVEHEAFEMKCEDLKKESKAARRKKREDAQKLPEVSKDIFYNVAVDLKEVFGTAKDSAEKTQSVAWDEVDEKEEEKDDPSGDGCALLQLSSTSVAEEESSGFRFSFFGDDPVEAQNKTDDYQVEVLKGAKVSWQRDPRLQDSSSSGEDEEDEEESMNVPLQANANEGTVEAKKTFFFFFQGDSRLTDGPKMFCRTGKLEDQRQKWEEARSSLTEEYRKKHKNAKWRVNIKLRN